MKYQTFFNRLKEWAEQGYIISERLPPELGKIKFRYSLSKKASDKLNSIKEKWSE